MWSLIKVLLVAIIALGIYLFTWPVPIEPQSWDAPVAPPLTGKYAVNNTLANFESIDIDGLHGPEAITSNANGDIYATSHEGWVIRWPAPLDSTSKPERWVNVGGRPLGIAFDAEQNLWVANAYTGLQKITPAGVVSVEADTVDGVPIRYADDLVVTPNGRIYFSDASTNFGAEDSASTLDASLLAIMEHSDDGRIIEFDPSTGNIGTVMDKLTFANGVTSDELGRFLLVAETGSYRVWKHWLLGSQAGQTELIMDNLPGFPDNIHRGQGGRYWLGLTSPRADILDQLASKPLQRKMIQRLPAFMRPGVEPYGHILAIDEYGEVLFDFQDPQGAYPATTGAWETDQYLYVSSLTASVMARYSKAQLGL